MSYYTKNSHFCLRCDDGTKLVHELRDLNIQVGELLSTVKHVSGWHCPVCGECEFDVGEGQRYQLELTLLRSKMQLRQSQAEQSVGSDNTHFKG